MEAGERVGRRERNSGHTELPEHGRHARRMDAGGPRADCVRAGRIEAGGMRANAKTKYTFVDTIFSMPRTRCFTHVMYLRFYCISRAACSAAQILCQQLCRCVPNNDAKDGLQERHRW